MKKYIILSILILISTFGVAQTTFEGYNIPKENRIHIGTVSTKTGIFTCDKDTVFLNSKPVLISYRIFGYIESRNLLIVGFFNPKSQLDYINEYYTYNTITKEKKILFSYKRDIFNFTIVNDTTVYVEVNQRRTNGQGSESTPKIIKF